MEIAHSMPDAETLAPRIYIIGGNAKWGSVDLITFYDNENVSRKTYTRILTADGNLIANFHFATATGMSTIHRFYPTLKFSKESPLCIDMDSEVMCGVGYYDHIGRYRTENFNKQEQ